MSLPVAKLAPQVVVLAVVGYWSMPLLMPSTPKGKTKKPPALPEVAASQLSPKLLPPPSRNPFQPPGVDWPDSIDLSASLADDAEKDSKPTASEADLPTVVIAAPSDFTLNATSAFGSTRMAVINGEVYAEKDKLPSPGNASAMYQIAQILPDKVFLDSDGRKYELAYADSAGAGVADDASASSASKKSVSAKTKSKKSSQSRR